MILHLVISLFLLSCASFEIKRDVIDKQLGYEIKIIQISDLHINKEKKIYDDLLLKINSINPDILLITGDVIDKQDSLPLLDNFLMGIDQDIRKYAVLGNWEHWSQLNLSAFDGLYRDHGVELLINEGREITIRDTSLYIYGTDDYTGGRPNMDNFIYDERQVHIIMTHSPIYFDHINEEDLYNNLLVFSGHTHGGQVTFLGKPLYLPQGSGDYLKGIYRVGNSRVYVSKGIGNSQYDLRLFAKPDIFEVIIK